MLLINIILITLTSIYCAKVIRWTIAWDKTDNFTPKHNTPQPISVVVAMHNEENNANQLMDTLTNQSLPIDEIIIVCDHCTDNTKPTIEEYKADRIKILENPNQQGKKHALRAGIETASNNYITVTDADCILGNKWNETISTYIATQQPDLLISPVAMKANDNSTIQKLMELEFLCLQVVTFGTAIKQKATMCNGANMTFRKDIYLHHDAKTEYISGDDMFLLAEIKKKKGNISYIKSSDSLSTTHCPLNIRQYLKQRTRWLRKATGYTDIDVKHLSIIVFIGNATWPVALLLAPIIGITTSIICLSAKTISEMYMISTTKDAWTCQSKTTDVILLALIYPFTLLTTVILTLTRKKNEW